MKLYLLLLLCVTGLVPVSISVLRTVPHKYELIKSPVAWSVAQNFCSVIYDDLATIQSETDLVRLNTEAKNKRLTGNAWVGLYNAVDSWRWYSDDLLLKNVTYTNWYPGCPGKYGWRSCGYMNTNGYWLDDYCTVKLPFVCYNANYTGKSKFIGFNMALTWHEAQAYCRQYHTDLASALNSTENGYIMESLSSHMNSWIDLYRDIWTWSDGSNVSNLLWAPGQPDNLNNNENCVSVENGKLSDFLCTCQFPFFCHTNSPMRSQTVRLFVKSKESVFDPAVQSSILERIKQKLEENGTMVNLLKWQVQPDGKIFHKKEKDEL